MTRLSDAEISCLRRIADEPSTAAPPCPDAVLKHLRYLGLIDFEPKLWLPLEAVNVRFHLTESGEEFLKRLEAGPESDRGKEDE